MTTECNWKKEYQQMTRTLADLAFKLELPLADIEAICDVTPTFPIRVTDSFLNRMRKGSLDDPLLLQVLPLKAETLSLDHWVLDPLQESKYSPTPGILHKYHGRCLLLPTPSCAIHCRYCFRRHFPYQEHRQSRAQWQAALAYIREDEQMEEVIFSGGDPLSLSNEQLQWFLEQLALIPQVKRIRFHSRMPIVLPARIDEGLLALFEQHKQKLVMVVHCNHPQEIDAQVHQKLSTLSTILPVFNQTVLLNNINNCADTLATLSKELFACRVLPYYLHLMDKVAGAHHFDTTWLEAVSIHQTMKSILPGYLVPRLVREIADEPSKHWVHPELAVQQHNS